jgi:hypothetical protein
VALNPTCTPPQVCHSRQGTARLYNDAHYGFRRMSSGRRVVQMDAYMHASNAYAATHGTVMI